MLIIFKVDDFETKQSSLSTNQPVIDHQFMINNGFESDLSRKPSRSVRKFITLTSVV